MALHAGIRRKYDGVYRFRRCRTKGNVIISSQRPRNGDVRERTLQINVFFRDLRALKTRERGTGIAEQIGTTFYPKCEMRRARSEPEARERKTDAITRFIERSGIDRAGLASMEQAERGAIARRADQRSPSEKTGALVLGKLERRLAA